MSKETEKLVKGILDRKSEDELKENLKNILRKKVIERTKETDE